MSGVLFESPFQAITVLAGRPRVVANAAASLDGRIARRDGGALQLSDAQDLARVHRLRAEADAVLVGVGTVLADDPALLVKRDLLVPAALGPAAAPSGSGGASRAVEGGAVPRAASSATHAPAPGPRQPLRVILDTDLRTPPTARLLDGTAPTLIYCRAGSGNPSLGSDAVTIVEVPEGRGGVHLTSVLADLAARGVGRLMVEGGSRVLTSFLTEGLADRFLLYVSPVLVGEGAPGLLARQMMSSSGAVRLKLVASRRAGEGALLAFEPL